MSGCSVELGVKSAALLETGVLVEETLVCGDDFRRSENGTGCSMVLEDVRMFVLEVTISSSVFSSKRGCTGLLLEDKDEFLSERRKITANRIEYYIDVYIKGSS